MASLLRSHEDMKRTHQSAKSGAFFFISITKGIYSDSKREFILIAEEYI